MNRWLAGALGAVVGGVAWMRLATRRNNRLVRPPVLDPDGNPYVSNRLQLSGGEIITWIEAGEGPPLLLIPGADGMKETWRFQVPVLARRFRVIATDLRSRFPDDATFDQWVKARTPARRWGRPEELVGAAVFLASRASDFVNGQVIYVDGGVLASL